MALSPLLAGVGEDVCLGPVEGTALLSGVHRDARLLSVRRSHDHFCPALSVPLT